MIEKEKNRLLPFNILIKMLKMKFFSFKKLKKGEEIQKNKRKKSNKKRKHTQHNTQTQHNTHQNTRYRNQSIIHTSIITLIINKNFNYTHIYTYIQIDR